MLCDVILPFLFLPICQTDETLARYAERGAPYVLVEMQGEVPQQEAILRFPGRKQYQLDLPCGTVRGRITAPLPWFNAAETEAPPPSCAQSAASRTLLERFNSTTLAEVSGSTIMFSDDAGPVLVFQRQD